MLNYLWGAMIIIGVVYAAFTGHIPDVTDAALDSAKEAVTLCITMLGVMAFWTGLMKIAEECGIIESLGKKMQPCIRFLFPRIPQNHPAKDAIVTNMLANIFGLGWAATPAGLKAMEELANLEEERENQKRHKSLKENTGIQKKVGDGLKKKKERKASNEMCVFLILNISSLQLIPVNIIAYRSQYGSANPTAIVGPAIVATLISTLVAVIFCKMMDR